MEFFDSHNIHLYIAIFLALVNGGILTFSTSKFLQVIQQAGYDMAGYRTWLRGTRYKYVSRLFSLSLLSLSCSLVTSALFDFYHSEAMYSYLGLIFYFYFTGVFVLNLIREPNKIPLVKTKRIARTIGLLFFLYFFASFILIALSTEYLKVLRFGVITLTPMLVPYLVILAFYILLPLEKLINNYYISKAKRKLDRLDKIIKIGITGSYAKTTNKFVLKQMLSQKFKVIASPYSYNTPLGLTRIILTELNGDEDIFIAEMGAKKKGDIKDLCNLVKPDHAIITSVGSQHLETFKTIENIKETKFELAESIENGIVVFNGNSEGAKELFEKYDNQNKLLISSQNQNSYAYATDIKVNDSGLKFKLNLDGKSIVCQSKLLGEFNLENICMCAALSYKLGVSLSQIKNAVSLLEPVSHRMELLENQNGTLVIDDSFNASVEGSKAAIETVALFKNKTKVIITPGIVEMGKLETKANYDLGKQIAQVFDYVIIVNEINSKAICEGLEENKFDTGKIFVVQNLEEANEKLHSLNLQNSVVLFENDLPDLFTY